MTKHDQMRSMINIGMYDIDSPTVIQELRKNFYSSDSAAKTPEKLVAQMRKEKNKARPRLPITVKISNRSRLLQIKKEIAQRRQKGKRAGALREATKYTTNSNNETNNIEATKREKEFISALKKGPAAVSKLIAKRQKTASVPKIVRK